MWNRAAEAHRLIVGAHAGVVLTDEQCRAHAELVADELAQHAVEAGPRAWFTVQHVDGTIAGRWAQSWAEAVLVTGFHRTVAWCAEDSDLTIRGQYFPGGRRAEDRSVFPVTEAPASRAELAMLEQPADALF